MKYIWQKVTRVDAKEIDSKKYRRTYLRRQQFTKNDDKFEELIFGNGNRRRGRQ